MQSCTNGVAECFAPLGLIFLIVIFYKCSATLLLKNRLRSSVAMKQGQSRTSGVFKPQRGAVFVAPGFNPG